MSSVASSGDPDAEHLRRDGRPRRLARPAEDLRIVLALDLEARPSHSIATRRMLPAAHRSAPALRSARRRARASPRPTRSPRFQPTVSPPSDSAFAIQPKSRPACVLATSCSPSRGENSIVDALEPCEGTPARLVVEEARDRDPASAASEIHIEIAQRVALAASAARCVDSFSRSRRSISPELTMTTSALTHHPVEEIVEVGQVADPPDAHRQIGQREAVDVLGQPLARRAGRPRARSRRRTPRRPRDVVERRVRRDARRRPRLSTAATIVREGYALATAATTLCARSSSAQLARPARRA